jgi:antitoxin HicB
MLGRLLNLSNGPIQYPSCFQEKDGGYVVTFPDFPDVEMHAPSLGWARARAIDALLDAIETCFLQMKTIPRPSPLREGEELVALSERASLKIHLMNDAMRFRV